MNVQEDDYPDGGDQQRREDEDVSPPITIGENGDNNIQHEASSRWRDRIKLSHDGAVAEG